MDRKTREGKDRYSFGIIKQILKKTTPNIKETINNTHTRYEQLPSRNPEFI